MFFNEVLSLIVTKIKIIFCNIFKKGKVTQPEFIFRGATRTSARGKRHLGQILRNNG